MTHVCYTLEEAAERLKLSETVLVRLSQYFKVPKAAYEEMGYLSFKGDLVFSEQDMAFFTRTKEHLVGGESLDAIKSRLHLEASVQAAQVAGSDAPVSARAAVAVDGSEALPQAVVSDWTAPPPLMEADVSLSEPTGPIRDIQDRKPYEKAAEQSFERYKSMHRSGLSKVFENMLKEVGASVSKKSKSRSPGASTPDFKPMRDKRDEKPAAAKPGKTVSKPSSRSGRSDALPLFRPALSETPGTLAGKSPAGKSSEEDSWTHLLQTATSQPRSLNAQLKVAAQLLRQRATGQADVQPPAATPGMGNEFP